MTMRLRLASLALACTGPCLPLFGQAMFTRVSADLRSTTVDGSIVYGHIFQGARLVRWTAQNGLEVIGVPTGGTFLSTGGCSWDGQVVCVTATVAGLQNQYRWTPSGGFQLIGDLPGGTTVAEARSCSGDGTLIVGVGRDDVGVSGTTWAVGETLRSLRPAGTSLTTLAAGSSYSGSIVVGGMGPNSIQTRPIRWLTPTTYEYLSETDLNFGLSLACASDASVVVGQFRTRPFRWTRDAGLVVLDTPFDTTASGEAIATSADGCVVVGNVLTGSPRVKTPFVWDLSHGARLLRDVLTPYLGSDPGVLQDVFGISPDGKTIVGRGYIARIPAPCAGDVDNGSSTGARDGSVTNDDLLAFLEWFEAGDVRADLDNGSATGTPDAALTVDDLIFFLDGFERGC